MFRKSVDPTRCRVNVFNTSLDSAIFRKSVDPAGVDEFLFLDLSVEECLELAHTALHGRGTLHRKHLQHRVDPLQRQGLQVSQHADYIRPKHLEIEK